MKAGRPEKPNQVRTPGYYFDHRTIGIMMNYMELKNITQKKQSEFVEAAIEEYCSEDFELLEQRLKIKILSVDVTDYLINNLDMHNGNDSGYYWRVCCESKWFSFYIEFNVDHGNETRYTYHNCKLETFTSDIDFDFNLDRIINNLTF